LNQRAEEAISSDPLGLLVLVSDWQWVKTNPHLPPEASQSCRIHPNTSMQHLQRKVSRSWGT